MFGHVGLRSDKSLLLGDFPPPLRRAEALRLLIGVPLPDRESSVRSWREGSRYQARPEACCRYSMEE
ncbi:hypothetical protein EYF80_025521 [Liparis tanakae]|uniref:Uncharacterized protein n=1 Tax=Liparis tanakae TaxID=230148 RepID=A0A4Z2HFF2_9TELE|nr:hypothetical protein EYF80_025521 [Liparis tanakae]